MPVLTDEEPPRLLKACAGTGFEERRDTAIVRLFLDTGMRLAELTGLTVAEVDFDLEVAVVLGKGRRLRSAPSEPRRLRPSTATSGSAVPIPTAGWDVLWIGGKGAMTSSGIAQMLRRRCRQAGLTPVHPHQFRHTFAHGWLAQGGHEGDLMRLTGWRSRDTFTRYAAAAADERAPRGTPTALAGGPPREGDVAVGLYRPCVPGDEAGHGVRRGPVAPVTGAHQPHPEGGATSNLGPGGPNEARLRRYAPEGQP